MKWVIADAQLPPSLLFWKLCICYLMFDHIPEFLATPFWTPVWDWFWYSTALAAVIQDYPKFKQVVLQLNKDQDDQAE